MARCEASTVRLSPARHARRGPGGPGRRRRTPRCWPAARAWSRCCRCGWRHRRLLVDINGAARAWPTSTVDRRRRPGRCAGPARRRAGLDADARRVQPLRRRWRWRTSRTPTIRNRGTTVGSLVHADAAAEMPVVLRLLGGSVDVGRPRGPPHDRRRRPLRRARWSRRCAHDEIAVGGVLPGPGRRRRRRVRGDRPPARRLRAVRRRRAGRPATAVVRRGRLPLGQRRARPSSTSPGVRRRTTRSLGDAATRSTQLDPADDIHATAAYRAHLVRVLTARRASRRGVRPTAEARRCMTEELARRPADASTAPRTTSRCPARRLLSDALRHDLGLTGTHVGCEHGVCGACTVLVDGRPMRSCLMFAVSAVDARDHHRRGADQRRTARSARCSRRSRSATGCSAASARPGSSPRSPPACAENPHPTADEAREMIAGNLCRCTGYQNIVEAVERAAELAELAGGDAAMTTKLFGEKVQRVEDERFLRGQGRYVDDLGAAAPLHAAVLAVAARARPDRRHRRRGRCSTSRACIAVYTYDDLDRRDGRAAAAADPAPGADPRPHAVRAGQGRGQLRRRGDRVRGRRRPLRRRGRGRPDPGRLRVPAARGRASRPPARRRTWCTTTCPATSAPGWSRRSATPRAAIAAAPHRLTLDLHDRAQRLHADGGPRHRRPLGPRRRTGCTVWTLDPDLDRRARRGRRQARPRPRRRST